MAQDLSMASVYRKITAVALAADNTYNFGESSDNSGRGNRNLDYNVFDIDTTINPITINLLALSLLFEEGSMGLGYMMKGTIVAGEFFLTFVAHNSEAEVNTICGNPEKAIAGSAGTAFILTPAGRTNWLLLTCEFVPTA